MSLRGRKSAAVFVAVLAVLAFVSGSVVCSAQSQGIVGSWEVVEAVRNSLPPQPMVGATLIFNADQTFAIERPQRTSWSGTYRVNPQARTIDLAFHGKNLTRPHEGDVWEGIYRLQPDGRLEINTAQGLDARPVDFVAGYDLTLMTLRRKN
jgi:uncharacterized protein (TIGR03067 family)